MSNIYVLIAAHREAIQETHQLAASLQLPKSHIVVVANGVDPPRSEELPLCTVLPYPGPLGIVLTDWWNYGIDWIYSKVSGEFYVAVLNSDCATNLSALTSLVDALKLHDLDLAAPDQARKFPSEHVYINRSLSPEADKGRRIPGYAFVLRGLAKLRFDPQFRFWYNDDDIEWQARAGRGTGIVGGIEVVHPPGGRLSANMPPELQRYAIEDLERFNQKWGSYPH